MTEIPEPILAPVSDARVLVIDDQPANTLLARRLLERAGLPGAMEITDPTTVRDRLPEIAPDIVLLDLKMPVLDGFAVLLQIQRYAAGAFLPVIVVTADDSHHSVSRALAMGAHDYLRKPYDAMELTLRVRNLLLTRMTYLELRRSRSRLRERLDVFEPELSLIETDTAAVRSLLTDTIASQSLRLALQPIVRLADGEPVGAEALSRFPDSALGGPAGWFTAAHRLGLAEPLEGMVVQKALRLLPSLPVSEWLAVNVSPLLVLSELERIGGPQAPWSRLVLELTEHVPVEDYTALNRALDRLRERGARLAVDDTGAGFASLRHLLDLGPDIIKIDIGIIRGVDTDPRRAAVAEMLVHFAERVGAEVVAEGIETPEQRDTLHSLGVGLGQGYLFGRPLVATETDEPTPAPVARTGSPP